MTFLLGRQATFGHAPPTYFRSITATREPSAARVHASNLPAVPLPRTTRSYSSMLVMFFAPYEPRRHRPPKQDEDGGYPDCQGEQDNTAASVKTHGEGERSRDGRGVDRPEQDH